MRSRWWVVTLATAAQARVVGLDVPPVGVTRGDEAVVFSAEGFDAPRLAGEPDGALRVEVDVGALTLAPAELRFDTGDGVDDPLLVVRGTAEELNAALDGLVYTPPEGFAGAARVTLEVDGLEAGWRIAVNAPMDAEAARDRVLEGVREIHGGLQPGYCVAFGPEAWDIAFYPEGVAQGPVVVAASWGRGRVVAVPDAQALEMHRYAHVSAPFYRNGLAWLADDAGRGVRVVTLSAEVAGWLRDDGYEQVVATDVAGLAAALAGADVFVPPWLGPNVEDGVLEVIGEFVRGGGGLFLGEYGVGYVWWWGLPIYQAPGNRLLREAGIGFVAGNRWEEEEVGVARAEGRLDAGDLERIIADPDAAGDPELERAGVLLGRIFDALGPEDPLALRLKARLEGALGRITPTPQTPVSRAWDKALVTRELAELREVAPEDMPAHRAADAVFGPVPEDAPRISRTVRVDPAVTRWHSTGLYAAPGDLVRLELPEAARERGFVVRFGGHIDDLSRTERWLRPPQVHWSWPLDAGEVLAASPFGGALYIDVGTESRDLEPFDVAIHGAVEAPYFVLGETTPEGWRAARSNPAPYAELVSSRVAISLPSELVRGLEDPAAVMSFWDEVVRLQDELAGHAALRHMAERINIDVQISLGYLHSGYPTQGPLVAAPELVDIVRLEREGSWGWFHELGHEGQRRPDKSWANDNAYTFDGAVEATVNLFTTYALDHLGIVDRGGWGWTASRVGVMRKAIAGLAQGAFAQVDVGVKLAMYLELVNHFGWAPWEQLLREYNAAHPDLPRDVQGKRDLWLTTMSRLVQHDLAAFAGDAWGLEISRGAALVTDEYPPWMPAVGGIEGRVRVLPGRAHEFDLAGEALSHDGVAEVVEVTEPQAGTLREEDGVWRYRPAGEGADRFSYGVRSSTGHVVTSEVEIEVSARGVQLDTWLDIPGTEIASLRADPRFPDAPSERTTVEAFDAPSGRADNYGARLAAFVVPPADGAYTLWIASDDNGELWVDGALVAQVPGWTQRYEWDRFPAQRSPRLPLVGGEPVFVEALMKEGGGGDHLAVAWAVEDGAPEVLGGDAVWVLEPGSEGEAPDGGVVEVPDAGGAATDGAPPDASDAGVAGDDGVPVVVVSEADDAGCACRSSGGGGASWVLPWLALAVGRRRHG